jgi:hypothetical protein
VATIEFLFLANHAEVRDGLLFALGVGWSDLYRGQPTAEGQFPPHHFAVGTSISIPWNETNQPHRLTIRIEQEDQAELSRVETDIEVGRPPGLSVGANQRVVFALAADVAFPAQGGYRVVAGVDEDERSVSFRVLDSPKPPF